jgi:uncharacterized protein YegP (UPF0339 family)
MVWVFDFHPTPDRRYQWRLWAADGRRVAVSAQAHDSRYAARRAAEAFKDAARELHYEVYAASEADHRWRATSRDGEAVASMDHSFASSTEARSAVEAVRTRAGMAWLD